MIGVGTALLRPRAAAPEADGGIHCSGITYEVYVHALQMVVGDGPGPSAETLLALKDPWYVRTDSDQGPVGALVDANLGDRVAGLAALQPAGYGAVRLGLGRG